MDRRDIGFPYPDRASVLHWTETAPCRSL